MPLYVEPDTFDRTQEQFTIATIGSEYYLQMGTLSEDNQRLFESIIDGHAGFFQDDTRVGLVRVTGEYDADNGVKIASLPELMANNVYAVDFSQARPGRDGEDAPIHFYRGVKPFYRGVHGRFYRGVIPFYRGITPFYRGIHGKFHRGVSGQQDEKRPFDAIDILGLFDGIPEEVGDYIWRLIMDRIPDQTTLRTEEETYNLIRARIEGYVTGYTEAFTDTLKTKLESTEIFTPNEKTKLTGVEANAKDDQTGSELLALLLALPEGTRLPYSWLDGRPTIPMDTLAWGGQWRTLTAYSDGTIVVDNNNVFLYLVDIPATNTTRPGDDLATNVEHLDIGSPEDITHAANSGLTITFTRRSGASFSITITSTDIYNAINAMTDDQKTGLRTIISAAAAVHNHDGRYYTETETDTLLDGKSDTGHNHDRRYYQESEVDTLLDGKSNTGHNHDGRYYTENEANSRFAINGHGHNYAPNNGSGIIALIDAVLGAGWKSGGSEPFTPTRTLGRWTRSSRSGTQLSNGGYYIFPTLPTGNFLQLSPVDADNANRLSDIQGLASGTPLVLGDRIFVFTGIDRTGATFVTLAGYWVAGRGDITSIGTTVTIRQIGHTGRMGQWTHWRDLVSRGIKTAEQQSARIAIQALGRDITVIYRSSRSIEANIYIVTDSSGVVAAGSGSRTLSSGQKAVGINFAGGVI